MNQALRKNWMRVLEKTLERLCPGYRKRLDDTEVYWTAFQTEWATDICFKSTDNLQAIYRPLVRGAMTAPGCDDILRFMNKRRSFQGEVSIVRVIAVAGSHYHNHNLNLTHNLDL